MSNGMFPGPQHDPGLVRVDSGQEQVAYMLSRFGDPATWSVVFQRLEQAPGNRDVERVQVERASGERVDIRFVTGDDDPFDTTEPEDTTAFLNGVIEAATAFSGANPPHHPGTLARFPVASRRHEQAVAVPMPVLAVSDGTRGLFAPPRFVVIGFHTLEPIGVGEFPGFNPDDWPPVRLGDWPPASLAGRHPLQLQGAIQRFSACWHRVIAAWFDREGDAPSGLDSDIAESLEYRAMLDLPELLAYYDRLNPAFAAWLSNRNVTARKG